MAQPLERGAQPPSTAVEQPQIKAALAGWEQAAEQAKLADREQVKLARGTEGIQAQRRDAEDLAAAIEQGKPAPKPKHVAQFEQLREATERRARATALVEERRWADVQSAFVEHADELREATERQFERARAAFLAALDDAEHKHEELVATLAWGTFFATEGTSHGMYRAQTTTAVAAPSRHVLDDGLVMTGELFERLRSIGAPPPPLPEGLNPQAYAAKGEDVTRPLQPRHLPLHEQGRARAIGVPGRSIEAP